MITVVAINASTSFSVRPFSLYALPFLLSPPPYLTTRPLITHPPRYQPLPPFQATTSFSSFPQPSSPFLSHYFSSFPQPPSPLTSFPTPLHLHSPTLSTSPPNFQETEVLRAGRALLTQTLQETEAQIKRLLEVKRLLEHDWSDKQEAFQLDHSAAKLVNHAVKAQFKPVSAALHEGTSAPESWRLRSAQHMDVCRREITSGTQLRGASDQALREVARDSEAAAEATDVAFNTRLRELEEAKAKLVTKDGMLRKEIAEEENSIASIRQSLQDKESPLQVAQSRHWTRSFRPGADRCLDQPHYRLKDELDELPQSIESLRQRLRTSEDTLEELHRLHEDFSKDILNREHTISF
ncbi:tektin A1 [Penaeus vannamei]|uniref:Tektin n=1 Tax=Penaeus vannamei TaxID=6689 RepID=A0A423T3R4_PENVA|nr:tektin A1 [Penaeus vannamei]